VAAASPLRAPLRRGAGRRSAGGRARALALARRRLAERDVQDEVGGVDAAGQAVAK